MADLNTRVEQSVMAYQSRLKHLDEMLERAKSTLAVIPAREEEKATLVELQRERDKLHTLYEDLRLKSVENWREKEIEISGPMAIWDVIAQKVENLLERIGK